MVDTGSFIGGLIIGYLGDKYKYRAIFLSPLLFLSSIVMFSTAYFINDIVWEYYVAMFLIGITIGGPYNIIGTVITIDLGKQTK
jgi:sugar phosphate permease